MSTVFQNPIMCFYAVTHEFKDKFMDIVKKYVTRCFIVAMERSKTSHKETNGEHFQCIFDMEETTYGNMNKTLIKEFSLRGQARNGLGRQYGKVTKDKINDIELACIYTTKEGNVISNIEKKQIQEWYEKSYMKKQLFDINAMVEHVKSFHYEQEGNEYLYIADYLQKVKIQIIKYHLEYNIMLPRKNILSDYIRYYIQKADYKRDNKMEVIEYYYSNNY